MTGYPAAAFAPLLGRRRDTARRFRRLVALGVIVPLGPDRYWFHPRYHCTRCERWFACRCHPQPSQVGSEKHSHAHEPAR
jgi:hypothetical protein